MTGSRVLGRGELALPESWAPAWWDAAVRKPGQMSQWAGDVALPRHHLPPAVPKHSLSAELLCKARLQISSMRRRPVTNLTPRRRSERAPGDVAGELHSILWAPGHEWLPQLKPRAAEHPALTQHHLPGAKQFHLLWLSHCQQGVYQTADSSAGLAHLLQPRQPWLPHETLQVWFCLPVTTLVPPTGAQENLELVFCFLQGHSHTYVLLPSLLPRTTLLELEEFAVLRRNNNWWTLRVSQILLFPTLSLSSPNFLAVGDSHLLWVPQGSALAIIASPGGPNHREAVSQQSLQAPGWGSLMGTEWENSRPSLIILLECSIHLGSWDRWQREAALGYHSCTWSKPAPGSLLGSQAAWHLFTTQLKSRDFAKEECQSSGILTGRKTWLYNSVLPL